MLEVVIYQLHHHSLANLIVFPGTALQGHVIATYSVTVDGCKSIITDVRESTDVAIIPYETQNLT